VHGKLRGRVSVIREYRGGHGKVLGGVGGEADDVGEIRGDIKWNAGVEEEEHCCWAEAVNVIGGRYGGADSGLRSLRSGRGGSE
jgi:hypothetical protein